MKKYIKGFKIIFLFSIIAKIASFVSEIVIAYFLGTSDLADVYSMVNGTYIVIYPMISIGIWSCFLPEYKKKITCKGLKNADEYANKIITIFIIISLIASILFFVFSDFLVSFIAPGFTSVNKNLLSLLLKIFSPYFIFDTVSTIYAAMLQSNNRFFGSQLREVVCYLPTIILGPLLFKKFGVIGFVVALLIGVIIRTIIIFPFINWEYKFKLNLTLKDTDIKTFFKKTPFALVMACFEQINTLVDKIMASSMLVGSVASLNYGSKLINAFNGFFTTPLTTALYPQMSELVAKKKYDDLKNVIYKSINIMAMIAIPVSIVCIIYRKLIISLLFERGSFDESSVLITSSIFGFYLIGLFFGGLKSVLNKLFYSFDKIKIVSLISFVSVILNIVLNFTLKQYMGISGLALATSISSIICFLLYLFFMKKYIGFNISDIIKKICIIIVVNVIPLLLFNFIFIKLEINIYINMFATLVLSLITIFALYYILRFEELFEIIAILSKKINFKHKKSE